MCCVKFVQKIPSQVAIAATFFIHTFWNTNPIQIQRDDAAVTVFFFLQSESVPNWKIKLGWMFCREFVFDMVFVLLIFQQTNQ